MDVLLEDIFARDAAWDKVLLDGRDKGIKQKILEKYSAPSFRESLKEKIAAGKYHVRPPHEALVPKDDGSWRTVYANEPEDRLLMTAVNDALFRLCPEFIHPSCRSYQAGMGCGKIAKEVAAAVKDVLPLCRDGLLGYKLDLSKYFDTVALEDIDGIFDRIESKLGPSAVMAMVREYYHDDTLLDLDRKPMHKYTSLRQGCAVAAYLADAALEPVDRAISDMGVPYWRYSDDILILGPDAEKAYGTCASMLAGMGLALNPKKVQELRADRWFTFLGYAIKNGEISVSKKRLKNFQKAVEDRTFRHPRAGAGSGAAMARVARYLYDRSLTEYGCAEGILPVVTSMADLREMDLFVLNCLRACDTGKHRIGGLGWCADKKDGVAARGRGRNVAMNREKRPWVDGYVPMSHMRALYLSSRAAYDAYAREMTQTPAERRSP